MCAFPAKPGGEEGVRRMPERSVLRAGAMAAVVGAILALVFNILHPRATDAIDDPEAELRLVADSGIWLFDHVALLVAVLLAFFGLWAISRSFGREPAVSWARVAFVSAVVGATVLLVTLGIDGIGTKVMADEWAAAGGGSDTAAFFAARAVSETGFGLFTVSILAFFAVTPVLFGVAVLGDDTYPTWLGWAAVLSGVVGGIAGFVQAFAGISFAATFVLFPIASIVFTLWALVMGVMLWGKASALSVPGAVRATTTT